MRSQCYLLPGRGDILALTPAETVLDLAIPEELLVTHRDGIPARRRLPIQGHHRSPIRAVNVVYGKSVGVHNVGN